MPFKKILVALDSSACAESAFVTATKLAKAEGATLTICTVLDPVGVASANAPAPPTDAALDNARKAAERAVADAVTRARATGLTAEPLLLEGEPAYELVNRAKRERYDAIVMGTHGRSGVKRLLLGSVAEAVLHASDIPVVIVHA